MCLQNAENEGDRKLEQKELLCPLNYLKKILHTSDVPNYDSLSDPFLVISFIHSLYVYHLTPFIPLLSLYFFVYCISETSVGCLLLEKRSHLL